jgi:monofunctional biosynthetic peptidoglycan transglycosylase
MVKRLLLAIPLAVMSAAWFYFATLPWPVLLTLRDPGSTAVMRQRVDEARDRGETLELRQEWVPLDQISKRLQRAVVVAEDGKFYDHDGIDWDALREEFRYRGDDDFSWFSGEDRSALLGSLRYYRENRDKVRGRSTITQQLAKNLYFSTDRSALRKFDEMIVTKRLERFLSKDRILELYLNLVEFGPGIFGAQAAAQHYFDRDADALSADQAAQLAATLPHPLSSNPKTRPGRMNWRKNMILARMGGSGTVQTVPLDPNDPPDPIGAQAPDSTAAPVDTLPVPVGDPVPPPDSMPPPPPDTVPPPG